MSQTHLDILFSQIAANGTAPFFKAISKDSDADFPTWHVIPYEEFGRHINILSVYLKSTLQKYGVQDGAIVGIWLDGLIYSDILHFYALCHAGYVPFTLSPFLPDPMAILELAAKAGAQALLHEPRFSRELVGCKIPTYTPTDINTLPSISTPSNHYITEKCDPQKVVFIQHTSGSTSGIPKLVPYTNAWLKSLYDSWGSAWNPSGENEAQDVFNIPRSVNTVTGLHVLLMGIKFGGSFAQSITQFLTTEELFQLTSQCGLNRINTFPPFLARHFQAAQHQSKQGGDTILNLLKGMRSIVYGGMPMLPSLEDWAYENKLPIMNALGATETGPLLRSSFGEHPRYLRPFPGLALEFVPSDATTEADGRLFKITVRGDSPNAPNPSLRDAEGNFSTGDLLAKGADDTWTYRGRDGDWIKVEVVKWVDTKTIEDYVRQKCSDLVAELVVVGGGRPTIVLLVEPVDPFSGQSVRDEVSKRIGSFSETRAPWEQISVRNIVVVPKGELPRTFAKSNVQRTATEKKFAKELDDVFA